MLPESGDLQFERAEFAGGGSQTCCTCKQPATPDYHQFNGRVFCGNCRQQIEQSIANLHSSGSLAQAFWFGLGAAALGAVIYYAVWTITRIEFGLIAVAVGYLVGKAVRKGSRSAGGRQYQIMAVALTYVSIVSSYVPWTELEVHSYPAAFIGALAAPLLAGVRNILGIIIIAIGLWQAWKINQRVDVKFTGPFSARSAI